MGLTRPSLGSLISRRAGREEQGEVMGVSQSVGSLSRVFGPVAAGFFFGEFGRHAAFFWGAVLVAVALFMAVKLISGPGAERLAPPQPGASRGARAGGPPPPPAPPGQKGARGAGRAPPNRPPPHPGPADPSRLGGRAAV